MADEKEVKVKSKINYRKINDILKLSHKVLKVFYILMLIVGIYVILKVFQELNVFKIILDILGIIAPLFVGLIVAWLFNPIVSFLQKKGVKRVFGTIFVYLILLGIIGLILGTLLPILYDQIVNFASSIPNLLRNVEGFLDNFLDKFDRIDGIDIVTIKNNVLLEVETFGDKIVDTLPSMVIGIGKTLINGISTVGIGLIIGFFLLINSSNVGDTLTSLLPKKWRKDATDLSKMIDGTMRNYVVGIIIDAFVIFVICSIVFSLIGLRAPLLFAIFCAITNAIPYVGPYIGAVPALIVGFSISPTVGILTLIAIAVIQFFEGNFLQDYIMSKATKLHPVTIISGLLLFGHYWGIIGMALSTPIIGIFKQLWLFFDAKFDFFGLRGETSE